MNSNALFSTFRAVRCPPMLLPLARKAPPTHRPCSTGCIWSHQPACTITIAGHNPRSDPACQKAVSSAQLHSPTPTNRMRLSPSMTSTCASAQGTQPTTVDYKKPVQTNIADASTGGQSSGAIPSTNLWRLHEVPPSGLSPCQLNAARWGVQPLITVLRLHSQPPGIHS